MNKNRNKSNWLSSWIISVLFVIVTGTSAQARSLKDVMKEMGSQYKQINTQSIDPATFPANADLSAQLRNTTLEAFGMFPQSVASLTDPTQKRLGGLEYQEVILQVIVETTRLERAFILGESAKIAASLAVLKNLKVQGHELFRPAD